MVVRWKPLVAVLLAVFGLAIPTQANDYADRGSIDPFYFLAGLGFVSSGWPPITPPVCASFFRHGGEQRAAEVFVEVAQVWNLAAPPGDGITCSHQPNGERLVVCNPSLAAAIKTFYAPTNRTAPSVYTIQFDEEKRLSFVAGLYARYCRGGTFHGVPSPAINATILILLAEGCEVSDVVFRQREVPNVMSFQVKPSARVARLFALVDHWQPAAVEWTEK